MACMPRRPSVNKAQVPLAAKREEPNYATIDNDITHIHDIEDPIHDMEESHLIITKEPVKI